MDEAAAVADATAAGWADTVGVVEPYAAPVDTGRAAGAGSGAAAHPDGSPEAADPMETFAAPDAVSRVRNAVRSAPVGTMVITVQP